MQRKLFELLDAADDAVVGVSAAGKIEYLNPRAASCFGFRRDELLGKDLAVLIPEQFRDTQRERMGRFFARPETRKVRRELLARRRDGSEVPVRITLKPPTAGGPPLAFAFVEDLREEKAAKKSSRLLEIFSRYTLTQIAFLDRDFTFLRVNEAYAKQAGRDVSDFPGRRVFDLYPSAPPAAKAISEQVVRTGKAYQAFALPFENPNHPDRGVTYWDWTLVPVLDDHREVEMLVLSMNDVTEREQAAEALRRDEQRLRHTQKIEAMGRLAGSIAHDFNNILTSIGGHADLLSGVLEDLPALAEEGLESIHRSTRRARRLTRQILAFARPEGPDAHTLIDPARLTAGMKDLIQPLLGEGVQLRIVTGPSVPSVRADPAQIEQAVLNLAVNAGDAMPEGGTLRIETACETLTEADAAEIDGAHEGPHVVLTVRDTGTGMDEETLTQAFEPFFTTKPPGRGTGLGLAVVQETVRRAGGHVRVTTAPGRGTSVRVFLPACAGRPAEGVRRPSAEEVPGGDETILVCEDDELVRDSACQLLLWKGYQVLSACHAKEALELAGSHPGPIHLLATDVVLPHMSGPRLADLLKERKPGLRVLFFSGYAAEELQIQDREGDTFLAKPYTSVELLRAVRGALEGEEVAAL